MAGTVPTQFKVIGCAEGEYSAAFQKEYGSASSESLRLFKRPKLDSQMYDALPGRNESVPLFLRKLTSSIVILFD